MIVKPYTDPPKPPRMALLTAERECVDETGERVDFQDYPKGVRTFCSFDTVRQLIGEGYGEAVCWNGAEVHWRHERLDEQGWVSRGSDVHVLRFADEESDQLLTLGALCRWRDWLAEHGAAPTGTTGSAAWSLLRATLRNELRTTEPFVSSPPLRVTVGGRQELGPSGQGSFEGRLEHWDIPAAYANELGNLQYGGQWFGQRELGRASLERLAEYAALGYPVFAKLTIAVPEGALYGPLPRRHRTPKNPAARMILGTEYPVGKRLCGIWCWQEIEQALAVDCRILHLLDWWVHFPKETRPQPFLPWMAAIEDGRRMRGLAGQLAKMTGNALWGRFCMDSRFGQRTIRSTEGKRLQSRRMPFRGGQPPAHDLAETVSGRVRARLYTAMLTAGDNLISAHTDGAWIIGPGARAGVATNRRQEVTAVNGGRASRNQVAPDASSPMIWRRDKRASRLELIGPQALRYWPRPQTDGEPHVVFAGVPAGLAAETFEAEWKKVAA